MLRVITESPSTISNLQKSQLAQNGNVTPFFLEALLNTYHQFNFCMLGNFHDFCCQLNFFKINFFKKILSGIPSECQTVWI